MVGPTGVGKTALAVELATALGAEIVGADAFQIYEGLPILTAQPDARQRARVPHHLVGCVPVSTANDVASYLQAATETLKAIAARGRPALVVGGTGLYVRALTDGLSPTPPADPDLRAELETLDLSALVERLRRADPGAPALLDLNNRRRVARAIEICEMTGQPLANFRDRPRQPARGLLLVRDRADLHDRIAANVRAMFAAGVVDEVAAITGAAPSAAQAIGFREIQALIRGEMRPDECVETITIGSRQYAKRQLTWFRRQTTFSMLNLTEFPDPVVAVGSAIRALTAS